ncbi:MAG TPA: hypothetical protein VHM90_17885, partial [Phycisphaerae bacterium]|nr:hypothetical protein [Phycisphaerae bacterium]
YDYRQKGYFQDVNLACSLADIEKSEYYEPKFSFQSRQARLVNDLLAFYSTKKEARLYADWIKGQSAADSTAESAKRTVLPSYKSAMALDAAVKANATDIERGTSQTENEEIASAQKIRGQPASLEFLAYDSSKRVEFQIQSQSVSLDDLLTRVSQRILYLANNEVLFVERRGIIKGLGVPLESIFMGGPVDAQSESYVRVLQSIANSILITIDATTAENRHDAESIDFAPVEKAARDYLLQKAPADYFSDLKQSLKKLVASQVTTVAAAQSAVNSADRESNLLQSDFDAKNKAANDAEAAYQAKLLAAPTRAELETSQKYANDINTVIKSLPENFVTQPASGVEKPSDTCTNVAAELRHKLNEQLDAAQTQNATSPAKPVMTVEMLRYEAAAHFVDLYKQKITDDTPTDPKNTIAKLKRQAVDDFGSAAKALIAFDQDVAALLAKRDATAALVPPLRTKLDTAKGIADNRKSDFEAADLLRKKLDAAIAVLDRTDIHAKIEELSKTLPADTPSRNAMIALRSEIKKLLLSDGPKSEERTSLELANAYFDETPSPSIVDPSFPATDAIRVLDELIAALRYDYIEAVKNAGEASPTAKHIREALDAAYAQRGEKAFILPNADYLRSSYVSTFAQKEANVGWHNMLTQHMFRQFPFWDVIENADQRKLRTLQEIDKQYWQNINTVRVAGGGRTNYVIAKDDVGNWYVKNYSANPDQIIKSAKSLAMFGYGPALNAGDLINEQHINDALRSGDRTPPPFATPKSQQLDTASGDYARQTASDLTSLQAILKTLPSDLKTALGTLPKPADPGVPANTDALVTTADASSKVSQADAFSVDSQGNGQKIIELLTRALAFHSTLIATVPAAILHDPQSNLDKAKVDLATAQTAYDAAEREYEHANEALLQVLAIRGAASQPATQPASDAVNDALLTKNAKDENRVKAQNDLDAKARLVAAAQKDLDAAKGTAEQARALISARMRPILVDYLERRKNTVNTYDTLVTFIGRNHANSQSAGSAVVPASQPASAPASQPSATR